MDVVSTGGAVGDDRVVRRGDKLLAGVGKERWRYRGGCWRYLLPRRRRGRCLLGCVSQAGRSSSGGSHCSAVPGSRALGRFGATADGKICALCMIRGVRAAKAAPSWQDLRAVYPQTAVCRAFRMHGAHILPKPARFRMHGARILPRTGDFPARGRFRDAWSAKLATDRRPGTHRGGILPRIDARERTAREYCHCQSGQGRIRAQSRHRRTLGNASREHFAIVERPGNAYSQRLANRAASSCGRAYCLAIALVPHESDGLFVQAVLCA